MSKRIFVEYQLTVKIFERNGYRSTGRAAERYLSVELPLEAGDTLDLTTAAERLLEKAVEEFKTIPEEESDND